MPTCLLRIAPPSRRRARRPHAAAFCALTAWLRRCVERARQRRALARLDDRLLRDVGLSRDRAETEIARLGRLL